MRTYEEFEKDFNEWSKEDILNVHFQMLNVFRDFETFIKLKYGDDYMNGWLHFLRTGVLKYEESKKH